MDTNVRIYDFPRAYEKVVVSVEDASESKDIRKQPLHYGALASEYDVTTDDLTQRFPPLSRLDMTARTWLIYPRTMLEQIIEALRLPSPNVAMVEVA